jgi:putative DNA primase/helicase
VVAAPPTLTAYDAIPAEMRARKRWVVFYTKPTGKLKENGQPKRDKVPMNPNPDMDGKHRLRPASTTDPSTWGTFEEACAAYETNPGYYAGIGYVFMELDDVTGIDIDGCIDLQTGDIAPRALEMIKRFGSYAEQSIGRDGVHILVRGRWENGWNKRDGLEVYNRERFFTMTGNHLSGTPSTIEDCSEHLAQLHAEHMPVKATPSPRIPRPGGTVPARDDAALIEHILRSRQGAKFGRLLRGDTSGYLSASEARWALIEILRGWTHEDEAQTERIMWQSALDKDKWTDLRPDPRGGGDVTFILYDIRRRFDLGGWVYEGNAGEAWAPFADEDDPDADVDGDGEALGATSDEPIPEDHDALVAALVKARAQRDRALRGWRICRGQRDLLMTCATHTDKTLNGDDRLALFAVCAAALEEHGLEEARQRGAKVRPPGRPFTAIGSVFNLSNDKISDAVRILTREEGGILARCERPAFAPRKFRVDDEEGSGEVLKEWSTKLDQTPHKIVYALPRPDCLTAADLAGAIEGFSPDWTGTRKEKSTEKKRQERNNELAARKAAEQIAAEAVCPECEEEGRKPSVTGRALAVCNHHGQVLADEQVTAQEPQDSPPAIVQPDAPPLTPDSGIHSHNHVVPSVWNPQSRRSRRADGCITRPRNPRRRGRDLFAVSLTAPCARCGYPQPKSEQPAVCQACTRAAASRPQITLCPKGHTLTQGRACHTCRDQLCGACKQAWTGFSGRDLCGDCEAARQGGEVR